MAQQEVKRRLLTNTAVAYGATLVAYAVGLVAAPYFIHSLGASAYGVTTLIDVFAISGWASLLEIGIQVSTVRLVAESSAKEDWDEVSRVVSTSAALYFGVGAIAAALLLAASSWLAHGALNVPDQYQSALVTTLRVLAVALALQFPGLAIAAAVEGTQRNDVIVLVRLATTLLATITAAILISSGMGLLAYMIVVALAPVAGVFILLAFLLRYRPMIRVGLADVSRRVARNLLGISVMIFFMRFGNLAFMNSDKIVIGALLTSTALTQYAIAAKLYAVVYVAGVLMNSAVLSASSHYFAMGDTARLQSIFLRGTKYAVAISVPLAAALFAIAPELCAAWVGDAYRSSGRTIQIWLVSIMVTSLVGVGSIMMLSLNRLWSALWLSLGSAAFNLAISIPAAIRWGVDGVILGSTIAWFVAGVPFLGYLLATLGIGWRRFAREVILSTLPWAAVAGLLALGGLRLLDVDQLVPLLLLLGMSVGLASVGFLRFGLSPAERASLRGRPAFTQLG
jgi:O-antigen/teichoic acid export membrane protein